MQAHGAKESSFINSKCLVEAMDARRVLRAPAAMERVSLEQ
jgi:hypothetical protein